MSARRRHGVWVSGERFNVDYLLDTSRGQVLRMAALTERGGTTGGIGRHCGHAFVAVYVAANRAHLVLQIGDRRMTLDDKSHAAHTRRLAGALSVLTVSRPGEPDLAARQWNGAGAILRRLDPGYDDLDDLADDFLADVADIVNSSERRAWMMDVKDPDDGPWEWVSGERPTSDKLWGRLRQRGPVEAGETSADAVRVLREQGD